MRARWVLQAVFILVSCGPLALGLDPNKPIRNYRHEVWQESQGLFQSPINTILQARNGYIWLGTYYGLVRFDGVRFTTFDATNTPQLQANRIWALQEDREGTLWIATSNGITRLRDGVFSVYPLGDAGAPPEPVKALAFGKDGELWLATNSQGLLRLKDGKIESMGLSTAGIRTVYMAPSGILWIGTQTGLYKYEAGTFTAYHEKDGLPAEPVACMFEDSEHTLWIGTTRGLAQMRYGKIKTI